MKQGYQILEHTADIGFEAIGETREEALENATIALVSLVTNLENIQPIYSKELVVEADDWEQLVVRYLNEVLFLIDSEAFLPSKVQIAITKEHTVSAHLIGELRRDTHETGMDVKAITYHQLMFKQTQDGFSLRVFVDI